MTVVKQFSESSCIVYIIYCVVSRIFALYEGLQIYVCLYGTTIYCIYIFIIQPILQIIR